MEPKPSSSGTWMPSSTARISVSGVSACTAVASASDGFTPNKRLLDRMVDLGLAGALRHDGKPIGLVLDVGGYYKNVITLAPSLEITRPEIDRALKLLDALFRRCVEG